MTTIDQRPDLLKMMREAQAANEIKSEEGFLHFFVGALSTLVDPEAWVSALATATTCVVRQRDAHRSTNQP